MSSTQLYSRSANGVTFADPVDPNYTIRFKNSQQRKSLNGVSVVNFVEEIVVNDLVNVELGKTTANDAVSVRIRISGTEASHARIKAILKSLATQLPKWADANIALGFEPQTAPTIPGV